MLAELSGAVSRPPPKLSQFMRPKPRQMSSDAPTLQFIFGGLDADFSLPASYIEQEEDHFVAMRARQAQIPFTGDRVCRRVRDHGGLKRDRLGLGWPKSIRA